MAEEDTTSRLLNYLKRHGQTNTFRLSRELNADRYKLQDLIKKLESEQAVEVRAGTVRLLKFPTEKKQEHRILPQKIVPPKKKIIHKAKKKIQKATTPKKSKILEDLQNENKELKEGLLGLQRQAKTQKALLESLQEENKKLEAKLSKAKRTTKKEPKSNMIRKQQLRLQRLAAKLQQKSTAIGTLPNAVAEKIKKFPMKIKKAIKKDEIKRKNAKTLKSSVAAIQEKLSKLVSKFIKRD